MSSGKVYKNLFWRFLERCGAQIVTLIVTIILARLLDPSTYGAIAIVVVIMTILQVFVDGGLGNALIQKKDSDDIDFSSVFYFNVIVCVLLYAILFLVAPLISKFYKIEVLTDVIRVLGITVIVSGIKNVQQAYVSKNFLFKKFFFSTLGGTIVAAIVGIWMAVKGFGVWALVAQHLVNICVDTIILWIVVKWKPKAIFSFKRLRKLLSFGWKIFASNLITVTYDELRSLIIGKKYSAEDLAYYEKGNQFPKLIITNINTSIDSVLFPALSEQQNDINKVKDLTRKAMKMSSYVIWPMMIGLAVCSKSFISLVLTDKWLPCVPFLQVFCFSYALHPIHTANLNAIKSLGRSDIYFKLEIIKKTFGFAVIFATLWFGVFWIAIGQIIVAVFSLLVNAYPNKKLFNYSFREQMIDLLPNFLITGVMGISVYCFNFINILPNYVILLIQVVVGIILYVIISKVTKNESYMKIEYFLKKIRRKKEKQYD